MGIPLYLVPGLFALIGFNHAQHVPQPESQKVLQSQAIAPSLRRRQGLSF